MIGSTKKKMPDKRVCTGYEVLIKKELGGTKKFPKKWVVNYCSHKELESQIAFIGRGIPYTPLWCPAKEQ